MKRLLLVGLIYVLAALQGCSKSEERTPRDTSESKKILEAPSASVSDIQIIEHHLKRKSNTEWMISGEIRNNSNIAIGVELEYTCYDEKGWPVCGGTWWDPKPGKNIPAGSTWPIKNIFRHEGNIKKMTLAINSIRVWVQKKSSPSKK